MSRDQTYAFDHVTHQGKGKHRVYHVYIQGKFHPVLGSQTEDIEDHLYFMSPASNPSLKLLEMANHAITTIDYYC